MIPGLPVGTKVKSIRLNEWAGGEHPSAIVELEPDNAYGVLDMNTIPIPPPCALAFDSMDASFMDPADAAKQEGGLYFILPGNTIEPALFACTGAGGGVGDRRRIIVRPIAAKLPPTIGRDLQPAAFDLLSDFAHYCAQHSKEGFWQALRNWAKVDSLLAETYPSQNKERTMIDTWGWRKRNG